jgi:glycyl-tRNA synthetase beta chain
MTTHPLLIELFTEELPPKALKRLGDTFAQSVQATLANHHLLATPCTVTPYATPRHLAVHLSAVNDAAPEQSFSEKLMPAAIGLDANGQATPALLKKLTSKGLEHFDVSQLQKVSDGKQDYLVAEGQAPGANLKATIQSALDTALSALPIPKVMRYQLADGVTSVDFVRPAHKLVVLWGDEILPAHALGLTSGRQTMGHRFLHPEAFDLPHADQYETLMAEKGQVCAAFSTRRDRIEKALLSEASKLSATMGQGAEVEALLDEVTALVEAPAVYVGEFEPSFLKVPQACLILTMRLNQKYFPLFDPVTGKLTHRFLIVSNMPISDPSAIISGNERVIRPRLADAEFFYRTDLRTPLHQRVDALKQIVYHNKLGSQGERAERVKHIAAWVGHALGADVAQCERAALLAKADLTTLMVGEFPELQGLMGCDYALSDNEPHAVAQAIAMQYRTRLETPITADQAVTAALFIADRSETLVGIWGIGLAPTGERDPFGLRRAALGIINAFEQLCAGGLLPINQTTDLNLRGLLQATWESFAQRDLLPPETIDQVYAFVIERYRNQLNQTPRTVVDAVLAIDPPIHQVLARIEATVVFSKTNEAPSLAAANKRIGNVLKKITEGFNGSTSPNTLLYQVGAEQDLGEALARLAPLAHADMQAGQFAAALSRLASLRNPVDTFFDDVMVMVDDPTIRQNRLALLSALHRVMNQVADISKLSA